MKLFIVSFLGGAISFFLGYDLGGRSASEKLYERCQGGSISFSYPSGTYAAFDCYEFSRSLR